jgi:hypothetical protein
MNMSKLGQWYQGSGFSTVYRTRLQADMHVAVKVHCCCCGERRLCTFRQELDLLCWLSHPHIVMLLAYSDPTTVVVADIE